MDPESWRRLEALVDRALDLEDGDRPAFVDDVAARDPELGRELQAFLAAEGVSRTFLADPLEVEAAALLDTLGGPGADARSVGPYRLIAELGRGGMGTVFLAERADGQFRQEVALKLVQHGLDTADVVARFRAERQILAGLHHPHIARLLDGGADDDGQPYFAMERVQGEPIVAFCDRRRLDVTARVRLFLQVCDAVEYAHRRLVVHRDLKPSNVLVTDEGQAKLLDFGIAKVLDPARDDGEEPLTRGAVRPMTPQYAAPEQLRGEPVTTATDVYSLGVVLHQLLSGRLPYRIQRLTPGQIERLMAEQEPEAPSAAVRRDDAPPTADEVAHARGLTADRLVRRLQGDLDTVVAKALRREPARRYASPRELGDDLRRHLDGRPVTARPDTWRYRAGKFVRRHRVGAIAAALVAVSLAAGIVGTLWQARAAVRQARRAEQVRQFVFSVFGQSDPNAAKGRELTARQLLDEGARRIRTELSGQPDMEAEMLVFVGDIDYRIGLAAESRPLYERALELRRGLFGDDSLEVAEVESALGTVLLLQGELGRARQLLESAVGKRARRLAPDDPALALSRGLLGRVRLEQGDVADAEALLTDAVAAGRARASHAELATNLTALGRVLHAKGDLAGAETRFLEALGIRVRLFGEEHTRVSEVRANLAAVLRDRGDFRAAEPAFRQVVDLDRRLLGPRHEKVAVDLNNLGLTLVQAGRYDEAEPVLRESLEIRQAIHGADSPKTAVGLHALARVLRLQGRLDEAERLSRRALELARAMLGEDHASVAAVREELALTLAAEGAMAEAMELARSALASYQAKLPPGHASIAGAQLTLGRVLAAAGRKDEAEAVLAEALRRRRERLGDGDWRTVEVLVELATCVEASRPAEAAAYRSAASAGLAGLGPDHPLARRAASR